MQIKNGYLVLYYCFDLGNEILLDKIEKILGKKPVELQLTCRRLTPDYLQYRVPPLQIKLGVKNIKLKDEQIKVEVDSKIYDFGVVSIRFWIPLQGGISDLRKTSIKFVENKELENEARKEMEKIKGELKEAIMQPLHKEFLETYAVFQIVEFDKETTMKKLLKDHSMDIASALIGEEKTVSDQELRDAIKNPLSYYPNDLVIIDWNASFLYDPGFGYDVLDVLEHAVIQLLELRTYDEYLDKTLDETYDDMDSFKGWYNLIAPYEKKLESLSEVRLDVVEVIEKVENSLKLIGDLYLAKVYAGASQRFYLDKWKESVNSKLDTLMTTYTMLTTKVEFRRNFILEVTIVALFVLDIALLLLGK